MKKSISVPKSDIVFAIVVLMITFVGINYVFYIKDISGHVANALSFLPLLLAIRFGRLLIKDMKKKELKEE